MMHLPMWLLVAALGQAPADGLLDAVPAGADMVVHVRGLAPLRDDLVAMLKGFSPELAAQAEPGLDALLGQFRAQFGELTGSPFVVVLRAGPPDDPGLPPIIVILKTTDYEGFIKGLAGNKDVKIKHEEGGFDSFVNEQGQTWYAGQARGVAGFGTDKTLISEFVKPGDSTLGRALSPSLRRRLLGGDLGLYVNLGALGTRYAEQIEQGKKGLLATLDQVGNQGGNAAMMEMAKSMYSGLFDSIKETDRLALSFDFSAAGLSLDGDLTVKPGSGAARSTAGAKSGDAAAIAKLPADSAYFLYLNLDARSFEQFQKLAMGMMSPGGKPTPELEAALAKQRAQGRVETISAISMAHGMRMFQLMTVADPKSLLASSEASMKAIKDSDTPLNFYKDIKVTPDAESYAGFKFSRVDATIDPEKVDKFSKGNAAQAGRMKAMLGDGFTSWYGIDDAHMLQITAPSWDKARAQIDAYTKGTGNLGGQAGFEAVRAKLPKAVNVLGLMSAQGIVRQMAAQFGAEPPADMPTAPALIGMSLTTEPGTGFEFHLTVPGSVGPIFAKGLGPMMQQLKPPGNP